MQVAIQLIINDHAGGNPTPSIAWQMAILHLVQLMTMPKTIHFLSQHC